MKDLICDCVRMITTPYKSGFLFEYKALLLAPTLKKKWMRDLFFNLLRCLNIQYLPRAKEDNFDEEKLLPVL